MLVARVCQLYPNLAPVALLHKFFLHFARWCVRRVLSLYSTRTRARARIAPCAYASFAQVDVSPARDHQLLLCFYLHLHLNLHPHALFQDKTTSTCVVVNTSKWAGCLLLLLQELVASRLSPHAARPPDQVMRQRRVLRLRSRQANTGNCLHGKLQYSTVIVVLTCRFYKRSFSALCFSSIFDKHWSFWAELSWALVTVNFSLASF